MLRHVPDRPHDRTCFRGGTSLRSYSSPAPLGARIGGPVADAHPSPHGLDAHSAVVVRVQARRKILEDQRHGRGGRPPALLLGTRRDSDVLDPEVIAVVMKGCACGEALGRWLSSRTGVSLPGRMIGVKSASIPKRGMSSGAVRADGACRW